MSHPFTHAIRQSVGQRDHQEDSADRFVIAGRAARPAELLTVIADGMGGHQAGEKASSMAVKQFISHFKGSKNSEIKDRLANSVVASNSALSDEIVKAPETYGGMGTTLLAYATDGNDLAWVSVGDSPLLLFRDGVLSQLNEDHSMAPVIEEFIESGALPEEARYTHPHRNLLRSAISGGEIAAVDIREEVDFLQPGDVLIGCSDGLLTLDFEVIAEVIDQLEYETAAEICEALMEAVRLANHPYQDNTTVAVILPKV